MDEEKAKSAAIYHYTNKSEKRPGVYQKDLSDLVNFAEDLGFQAPEIFCDMAKTYRSEGELGRLIKEKDRFDAVIVKDFFHLSKNTEACFKILATFLAAGASVYTMKNGSISMTPAPYNMEKRVATYSSQYNHSSDFRQNNMNIQNDIFKYFVAEKTEWQIIDQYADLLPEHKDEAQIQLDRLIQNRKAYDILLVRCMNDINNRTAKFWNIRDELQIDIYSLREGFLPYKKQKVKGDTICIMH